MTSGAVEPTRSTSPTTPGDPSRAGPRQGSARSLATNRLDAHALFGLSLVAIVVGLFLVFGDVAMTGLTWDEWVDYGIAEDYAKNQSFLDNTADPSQARFSHLLGAASFALFGVSYFAFKLPFVLASVGGGLLLWLFLRRRVSPPIAILTTALYFTCPYVLSAARAGGTAGDALVGALVLAFIVTTERWMDSGRFWPYGAMSGIVCGAAIGAKWTCALLVVAAVSGVLMARRARGQAVFDGPTWTSFLAHWWFAIVVALGACPTLLLGIKFIRDALQHSIQFEGKHLILLGATRASAPWFYIPAVLASKMSPVQLAILLVALWQALRSSFRPRRFDALVTLCLLSILPVLPLASKAFQNAQYYLPLVPVTMILTAKTVDRWIQRGSVATRYAVHAGGAGALALQVALSIWLYPDYLQAGRQFGPVLEGEFPGPAVNHCQGLPFAVRELNDVVGQGGPSKIYSLQSCRDVVTHAATHGPERAIVEIAAYPSKRPPEAHYVLIPAIYDYESKDEREQEEFQSRKRSVTSGCRRVGAPHPDYRIYECPKR